MVHRREKVVRRREKVVRRRESVLWGHRRLGYFLDPESVRGQTKFKLQVLDNIQLHKNNCASFFIQHCGLS